MGGFGGGMSGGFGVPGMMHPLGPSMGMVGPAAMHPYGFGPTHAYGYGYGGGMPYGYHPGYGPSPYAGLQPLSPAGLGPYNPAVTHPWNPWGPINPAGGNHPLAPLTPPNNHPLTPLYPPNHPLTPLQPPNNYVWPWWWYNNPSNGYTYQMYPFSNFWDTLGFYGHYGYYGPQQGMVVSGVNSGTLANQLGLVAGDVITAVNGEPVKNAEQFVQALRAAQGTVSLSVYDTRTGRTSNMSFTPQDAARYAPAGSSGNTPATESQGTQEDVRNEEAGSDNSLPQP
jgi:PDZ domain